MAEFKVQGSEFKVAAPLILRPGRKEMCAKRWIRNKTLNLEL
jgi:hypothetical protein